LWADFNPDENKFRVERAVPGLIPGETNEALGTMHLVLLDFGAAGVNQM
jgi:hypothetical protein